MPSMQETDTPDFRPVGDFRTVDGLLVALQVADASPERQRAAIAATLDDPYLGPTLAPLLDDLRRRGLA